MDQIDWGFVLPGVIVGTLGWLLYLAGLPMIGAIAGIGVGATLGFTLAGMITATWAPLVLTGIGAALGGFLGFWLVRVFQVYLFFVAGACLGGTLGFQFLTTPSVSEWTQASPLAVIVVVGVMALAGGLICVRLRRFIVAVITSLIGVFLMLPGVPERWQAPAMIIGVVIFLAIQIGMVRRYVDQEAFDRRLRRAPRREDIDARTAD